MGTGLGMSCSAIDELRAYVDGQLEVILSGFGPRELYSPALEFVRYGGKRVRSVLTLLAGSVLGLSYRDKGLTACALAIELIHTFTLIHDDIMDESETRRGRPTLHRVYGLSRALLTGDALFALAFSLFRDVENRVPSSVLVRLAERARNVCEGQQLDLSLEEAFSGGRVPELKEYLSMVGLKTSALFQACMEAPILLVYREIDEGWRGLVEAAYYAGLAFQVMDDWLDAFTESTKKTPYLDFQTGKPTVVLLVAYEELSSVEWGEVMSLLEACQEAKRRGDLAEAVEVGRRLCAYLRAQGIDVRVQAMADQYFARVEALLEGVPLSSEGRVCLQRYLESFVRRTF